MPSLETGIFIMLNLVAFGFMFVGFRNYGALHVIPMILFWTLSLLLFSGYDVVTTSTTTDGSVTWTEQKYLINSGDIATSWMGWIYFLIGISSVFFFIKDIFPSRS